MPNNWNLIWMTGVVFSETSEDAGDSPVAMETETPQPVAQAGAAYSECIALYPCSAILVHTTCSQRLLLFIFWYYNVIEPSKNALALLSPDTTQLFRTSNFSGSGYHAVLLIWGLESIVLLFVLSFSQPIREDVVIAAYYPLKSSLAQWIKHLTSYQKAWVWFLLGTQFFSFSPQVHDMITFILSASNL